MNVRAIAALTLLLTAGVFADVFSPTVSYQYAEGVAVSPAISYSYPNGLPVSPTVSYQYYEWPGNEVLGLLSSRTVSYYYGGTQLTVVVTDRVPTTNETMRAVQPPGTSPTQLVMFVNGTFTANAPSPSKMTIVLTHGWNDNPNGWAKNMAQSIADNLVTTPNIVAWNWTSAAASPVYDPGTPADRTGDQGRALGDALQTALGANYAQPIHFIGHSFGTLVNAAAVNYIHRESWAAEDLSPIHSWTNLPVHVTLFDEAEVGTGVGPLGFAVDVFQVLSGSGDFLSPKRHNWHPLPKTFVWADNYITAFGLPHPEAVNIILTNSIPARGLVFSEWYNAVFAFHNYPYGWYDETIQTDASALGWKWSFERLGFVGSPATNTVYMQSGSSPWNVVQTSWDNGTNWLDSRILNYHHSVWSTLAPTAALAASNAITAYGTVDASQLTVGPPSNSWNIIINFFTSAFGGLNSQSVTPKNLGLAASVSSNSNVPAYAWMQILVPTNAVAMSFDFKLLGDGANDSFVAAINGTNVFSLAANLIETNLLLNSGQIPVSAYAGQTVELFFGIVGGTSTDAQITVQDMLFYTLASGADFGISDSVGDGIPDLWRSQYFPQVDATGATTNNLSCSACDPDGDGRNNLAEFIAATSPVDSSSVLRITSIEKDGGGFAIQWTSVAGKSYSVYRGTNLDWNVALTLTNGIAATPPTNTYIDLTATNGPAYFYRVGTGQ